MTNQEIIDKVNLWQNAGFVHPLTCGKNNNHLNLEPKEINDSQVVLVCPNCDYTQDWIPDYVLTSYVRVRLEAMKRVEGPEQEKG